MTIHCFFLMKAIVSTVTTEECVIRHPSEIARQRVSPLVSGVRAGLSGLRRVRVVSVSPFPLELTKRNIFA